MGYEELLEQAYEKVKTSSGNGERFEIPKLNIMMIGNKTIICNFSQIVAHIRRKPEALCKFFSKELAAMCKCDGDRLILNRKIPEKQVQEKFRLYVDKCVLCKECGKPDTELVKKDGLTLVHCLACGAKSPLGKM